MKKLAIISLILNLALISALGFVFIKLGGLERVNAVFSNGGDDYQFTDNPYYIERTSLFERLTIPKNSIIFIGDSITFRSEWSELFTGKNIVNRGIGSDTTEGVLNRLGDIISSEPEKIFIMIGINDISNRINRSDSIKNYTDLLQELNDKLPMTQIFVQSILPILNELSGNDIDISEIIEFNEELKKLSTLYNATYIDLYSDFAEDGQLRKELTVDGVHLNGDGYILWRDKISDYVYQ